MYIYIYIYTSVNPCIYMHGVKQSRVKHGRVQWYRAQPLRTVFSNATSNVTVERQLFRVLGGTESVTEQHVRTGRPIVSSAKRLRSKLGAPFSSAQWIKVVSEQPF